MDRKTRLIPLEGSKNYQAGAQDLVSDIPAGFEAVGLILQYNYRLSSGEYGWALFVERPDGKRIRLDVKVGIAEEITHNERSLELQRILAGG